AGRDVADGGLSERVWTDRLGARHRVRPGHHLLPDVRAYGARADLGAVPELLEAVALCVLTRSVPTRTPSSDASHHRSCSPSRSLCWPPVSELSRATRRRSRSAPWVASRGAPRTRARISPGAASTR